MATYVLVHGAWHGGWAWRRLRPLLQAAGHEVHTPTLTGLGDRAHLATPDVDLTTHVLDVVNTLNWEDAHDAILVGHSYGGLVIAGAAERTPARLGHLVYLDALVPADGDTWRSVAPDPPRWAAWDDAAARDGGGWLLQHPGEEGLRGWGVTDPADLAWAAPRLTPQPIGTSREPVRLGNPAAAALPRTYVWASYKPTGDRFARFREAARAPESGWRYQEVTGGHDAMVTHAREIADLLLELA